LALRVRRQILFLSSGIVPNCRYSKFGSCQSASGSSSLTTAAISPSGPRLSSIGPIEAPGFTADAGTGLSSPGGVPGAGT
jgi:hypothetical protein